MPQPYTTLRVQGNKETEKPEKTPQNKDRFVQDQPGKSKDPGGSIVATEQPHFVRSRRGHVVWMAAWEERAEDSGCSRRLTGKDPLNEVSHDPYVQGPQAGAINRLEKPCRRPGPPGVAWD